MSDRPLIAATHGRPGRLARALLVVVILVLVAVPWIATAQPVSQGNVYIVVPGDTLSMIAARLGVSALTLARANNLGSADLVYAGERLVVPAANLPAPAPASAADAAAVAPASAASDTSAASDAASITYVVRRGDTLSAIARRFKVSVAALAAANHLRNTNFIYVGQRLVIPGAAPAPTVTPKPNPKPGPTPTPAPPPPPPGGPTAGRWIDVNLSKQVLVAYDGQTPVFTTKVSTGLPGTPTVVGTFKIYIKLVSTRMTGPGYDLPNVPYTMYFYKGYGLHGTYWHNNFGHPMSHGCVNLSTQDAAWLFGFASVGTPVVTHY
jgi:LysM repeat protein